MAETSVLPAPTRAAHHTPPTWRLSRIAMAWICRSVCWPEGLRAAEISATADGSHVVQSRFLRSLMRDIRMRTRSLFAGLSGANCVQRATDEPAVGDGKRPICQRRGDGGIHAARGG